MFRLRSVWLKAILALLAIAPWPSAHADAQETIALAIEGWQSTETPDGVVTYRCASDICAAGSVVSYKAQPHRAGISLETYDKHHRGLAEQNKRSGAVKDVTLSNLKTRQIDGVEVLQIDRDVVWPDGSKTYSIEARLIGAGRSFSLVSDSPKREWTDRNFDGFLRNLIAIAGLAQP